MVDDPKPRPARAAADPGSNPGKPGAWPAPPGTVDEDTWIQTASMAELGMLTATLLHELRQPLFAIKACAQLARVEPASPVQSAPAAPGTAAMQSPAQGASGARTQRLDQLLEQVDHIEDLIRYYGAYGRSNEPEVVFDLNEPVRRAVEMLAHRARKASADVQIDLAPGPLHVSGRELAARQVAINLLQNALDAVEGVEGPRIEVRTRDLGTHARLEVEDTGPGIPDSLKARMFQPFVTTKPPGQGTGLGLFIARRLVVEARGRLELAPTKRGGARFVVDIPKVAGR